MIKYFMVIDGAINSTHDVFGIDEAIFDVIFPDETDIAFLEEVEEKVKSFGMDGTTFFNKLYSNQVDKKRIIGLHGILHSTGSYCRKEDFPTRKEADAKKKSAS